MTKNLRDTGSTFCESIRRSGFWLIDALSGGIVYKNLLNLEKKLKSATYISPDDLQKILKHAVSTTEFYSPFRSYSSIIDFPIIKKKLIREKYSLFISSMYKNKVLTGRSTSGSTGERFLALQNREKRKKVLSELIYFHEICGFRLGYRYVYVKAWNQNNRKTKLVQLAENLIMFDCSVLSEESMNNLYQLLRQDRSIKCLTGYANSLGAIASYFDKMGYSSDMFNIKIIICGSERLEHNYKYLLKKVFGCPVVSRYSNEENGILAQQPINDERFVLNTAHYFFETLKLDKDEPASPGEPARLVLTDLYNYAMPLIRYDTEDVVIMDDSKDCGVPKKMLREISGRQEDMIYDTRGNMINPTLVVLNFETYSRLSRFQLIQESARNFTLKLEGVHGLYGEQEIRKTVENLVGRDAIIKIEHMDKIPHLTSGKFRRLICKLKNNSDKTQYLY